MSENLARLADHLRTVSLRTNGPFTLSSGGMADWYLDARQTTFSGKGARLVGEAVVDALEGRVEAVGGMTMGADPIAVAAAIAAADRGLDLVSFSVRKEEKRHGAGGRLVGPVQAGQRVVVVEDTTTTGRAITEAIGVLRDHGCEVVGAIALFDRSGGEAAGRCARSATPYRALLTPPDLGIS